MLLNHQFVRDEVLPSWWANAIQQLLSLVAHNFQLTQLDNTHVEVVAGANDQAAILAVGGKWRWVEATITYAHPGGAAGAYPVFACAANNNITSTPAAYTDDTDYAFRLQILPPGGTPAIVAGVTDFYRQVGVVQWDGTKITRVDQTVPAPARHAHTHATGQPDAIGPADIGAASSAQVTAETARAEAAEAAEQTIRAAADAALGSQVPPIGAQIAYAGYNDALAGVWVVTDGRLIDSTLFPTFDTRAGHAAGDPYNGGVNPGVNGSGHQQCRIPDKRGRKSAGAINMGTGAGPADNSHVQAARGAHGGEATHATTAGELPVHGHPVSNQPAFPDVPANNIGFGEWSVDAGGGGTAVQAVTWPAGSSAPGSFVSGTGNAGSGSAHNNVDPYEADVWLVRIA